MSDKCEHETTIEQAGFGNISLHRCTAICGEKLVSVRLDKAGNTITFTADELARLRRIEAAAQKVARYAPFVKRSYYARILAEEVRELAAALEAK